MTERRRDPRLQDPADLDPDGIDGSHGFEAFVANAGGRVRRALTPVAGVDAARDATTDALVHAWRHWDRVRGMANPVGYVYTVARRRLPRRLPRTVELPAGLAAADRFPRVEPRLAGALAALPERQRVAVYLRVGCGWSGPEVAAVLGVSVSTVRNHVARGLTRLQRDLGVDPDPRPEPGGGDG